MAAQIVPDPPYVLFVEIDRDLREQVGDALHAAGLVPLLAADASEAVDYMAGASTPVLIIVDLDSPGLKPSELLARFRTDARWARVPVVVTGTGGDMTVQLQVDGVLPKPVDAKQLVTLARRIIARGR